MRAGRLRHRVTLLAPTRSRSTTGEPIDDYAPAAIGVPAEVAQTRGTEYIRSGEEHRELDATITMRWRDDIDQGWRVQHRQDVYEVLSDVDITGRARYVALECKRIR